MSDIDSIKDKIRKLLALAADPGAVGAEAETAGRQAAKLMAKFELDEYDLQGGKAAIHDFDLVTGQAQGQRPGKTNGTEVPPWIGYISVGVARYCNVRTQRYGASLQFCGRRTDVELAVWLHNTLVTRCYAAGTAACKGQGTSAASAFRNGYAGQIQKRLYAMSDERSSAEREEVSSSGTALVVVRQELNQVLDETYGATRLKKSHCKQSNLGRQAGESAHIPTHRPICC